MAQVGITLKPGTGYTAQYLADHATLHLHGLRTLADDGVALDGTLTPSPAPASAPLKMTRAAQPGADGTYTYTALVAPQTIAKGDIVARITLKQSDDATAPASIDYDYRAPEAGFPYNAGQNNKLLLTVSKAGVSAVFTLTPWDDSQEPTEGDVTVD